MLKKGIILLFLLTTYISNSQNIRYFDSIKKIERNSTKKEFLNTFLNIPFDIALSNIKDFETLSKRAIEAATENKDSISLAKSYKKLALVLHFSHKDTKALEALLTSIAILEKLNDQKNIGATYLDLGWKLKRRDLNKAINYMRKGISVLKKYNNNSLELSAGYNNYGVLLQYKSKLDSALYYHKKSLDICLIKNDSVGTPFAQTHIAEVFLKQQKFEKAKIYLDEALKIRQLRNDVYGITDSNLYLGDLYFAKKEFKKAINYFKKGYQFSKQNNYFPLKKYATEHLHKAYDSLKKSKEFL